MSERSEALGFVIWIDPQCPPGLLRGSVEHVASSLRVHFADGDALLRFLEQRRSAIGPARERRADSPHAATDPEPS